MADPSIQQNIFGTGNYVVGQGTLNVIQQLPELDKEGYRNLAILRDRVRQFWIVGVLEKSLHKEKAITLDRQSVGEAVDHPWARILEVPDQASHLLPSSKKTSEIFHECGRALLILGEPGSGKTITMLELGRDLIQKSETDPMQPVPVVFNLSSWSVSQQPLLTWLIEELRAKYFVPRKQAEFWLRQNRLLLLLDGLDEVSTEVRPGCVKYIHKYIEEQGCSGIVVCCRIRDYTVLPLKLKLNAAICVQPLSFAQIDQYLKHSGESAAALRLALSEDAELRELARTPLILSIMSIAYQNKTSDEMMAGSLMNREKRRQHIFDQFIDKMFQRRGLAEQQFGKTLALRWLSGIAHQMTQRVQTVFLVDDLQPDWLPYQRERWVYFTLSRIFSTVMLLIAPCVPLWFLKGMFGFIGLPVSSYIIAISCILAIGSIEPWLVVRSNELELSYWREIMKRAGIYVFVIGALTVCTVGWRYDRPHLAKSIGVSFLFASMCGLYVGIVFGLRAVVQSVRCDIRRIDNVAWSWRASVRGMLRGAITGLSISCFLCILIPVAYYLMKMPVFAGTFPSETSRFWEGVINIIVITLIFGVMGAIVGALFSGLIRMVATSSSRADDGIRLMWRSARRAGVRAGLGLGIILLVSIMGCQVTTDPEALKDSVVPELSWANGWLAFPVLISIIAAALGMFVALWYGGLDILQHYTLRLLLARRGYAPARLTRFLKQSCDLMFLQRVGGGYIFIHRLLLEHFAAMGAKVSRDANLVK